MKLKELLTKIPYEIIQGSDEIEIPNISWDSKRVKANSLFICVRSKNVDRHNYASAAIDKGAAALIVDRSIESIPRHITVIKVENTRKAMAFIANTFYDEPSKGFNLIGITGTNGKTSVSFFIAKILEYLGRKAGIIGTIENCIGDKILKTEKINPTTPDSMELQASFAEMVKEGVTDALVEVTSTALDKHRVDNCDFDIGIFTNLSQDHLDEHGTMENYKKAKMKLFKMCRLGIINADDEVYDDIKKNASCDVITYGIESPADFMAKNIKYSENGITFTLNFCGSNKNVQLNTLGKFNVYNSLASIAACYFLGIPIDVILDALSNITGVRGRFESVPNTKGYSIIVDYAHSPDSLKNILTSVRELTEKKVIVVFGCGGNRDKTKRPIMGEISGKFSDFCIITSDNPRKENPNTIIEDIEKGMKKTQCSYEKIPDRKMAIFAALTKSQAGDIVIIAGKGHENYQILGEKIIHFDDVEVVKEYFQNEEVFYND